MKIRPDENVLIGTRRIGAPENLAILGVKSRQPTADAEFSAAITDDYDSFGDDRRHGHRFALIDIAQRRVPGFLAGRGVDRHGMQIERVVVDPSVEVGRAAIDHIATGNTLRTRRRLRFVGPLDGAPGLVRSSAYRILGHGVTMYIVLLTTSGAASCPRVRPVENVQASFRFLTVWVLMSVRVLKRVAA